MTDPRHPFLVTHGLIDYPFPLTDGRFAELTLPERLESEDAERLIAFVASLLAPSVLAPEHEATR